MSAKKKTDYDDLEEELEEAHKESKSRKEGSGMYGSIFKDDAEFQRWKCKNGDHVIDIIPYRAGKFDPNRTEGKAAYVLDIYVHKGVGTTEDQYVCPSRNYKKKCPICEEIKRLADKDIPYDDYKADVAKRVNVYNIWCDDTEEEREKGVQVWDISNFFMEDKLRGRAKNKRTGEEIYYASPKKETGRSISFTRAGKGKGKVEFTDHEFLKRDYDIPKDIIEQAVCLDEIIHVPTYEELYEAYHGEPYKEVETRRKKKDDDDTDERPVKRRREKDDDDTDERPVKRRRAEKDDDDDVELTCPGKGTFGEDLDQLAKCAKCEIWDDCAAENDRLEKKSKKKRSKDEDDDDEGEKPKRKKKQDDDDDDEKPAKKKSKKDDDDDDGEDEKPKRKKKRSKDEDDDD